ncbi:MAG: adenylate/guanylate cyclase domain-containing protein [Nocardioidaceae bacterium]
MRSCPQCSASCSESAKFCPECGFSLAIRLCPHCGVPAAAGKFCSECGGALDGAGTAAPASVSVQPPAAAAPVAERRITTVLFADLVGFTTRAEGLDPEDVRELLSRYFAGASTIVARYGGTVEKFIGDAVMAVWGVPVAHEDDAERAVRAGLELVMMTETLGEENNAPGLTMRVGLVTGEVAVTLGATGEGMVAGDAVNTAARVQTAAAPGEVWVDETTRSLAAAAITYEATGEHQLKGKADPVRLFAARSVVGSVRGVERMDGLEAPLVGRDRELRLVKELFHSAQESGLPSLVLVEGEAGVGKSRLGWEFEKYVDGLSALVLWHRGRCLAYGDGVAFWALVEAIRGRLGLVESDSGAVVDEKLQEALDRYVPEAAEQSWIRPRLAVLLGGSGVAGTFNAEELYAAWAAFFEHVGQGNVVVLVIDDAQHADDGLIGFLEHLMAMAGFPIFVMALVRPELLARRPDLAVNRRATVLHLDPLGDEAVASLLDGLVAQLPGDARAALVQRSEGIPLYAVETIRGLIDRDLVIPRDGRYVLSDPDSLDVGDLAAPASLQALVAARLDALSAAERRVVADASVLGMTLTDEALAELSADVPDREGLMRNLVRKQILRVETDRFSASRGQYRFVQAVVRQVAYDTLSKRDRKARHLAVAAYLEAQPDSTGDLAAVLAQHCLDALASSSATDEDRAELLERSIGLLERAAARATALGASAEALRYLEQALELADDRSKGTLFAAASEAAIESGQLERCVELANAAVEALLSVGDEVAAGLAVVTAAFAKIRLGDSLSALELVRPHWERLDGRPDAKEALLNLGRVMVFTNQDVGDEKQAEEYLNKALRLAEAVGDRVALCKVMAAFARQMQATGAPFMAEVILGAQVSLARELQSAELLSNALIGWGIELLQHDVKKGVECYREAFAAYRQTGNAASLQAAEINLAIGLWTSGEWDELPALLKHREDEAFQIGLRVVLAVIECWIAEARGPDHPLPEMPPLTEGNDNQSDLAWFEAGLVSHLVRSGSHAEAADHSEAVVEHALRFSGLGDDFIHLWPPAVRATLAAGQFERAAELMRPVVEAPDGLKREALTAHCAHLSGVLASARGNHAEVESSLSAAVKGFETYGSVPLTARARADLGRWLMDQGRPEEAEPLLEQARAAFVQLGADGWLREYGLANHGAAAEKQTTA